MQSRVWLSRLIWVGVLVAGIAWAVRPLEPGQGPENWAPGADKVHHFWVFTLLFWAGHRWAAWRPAWALALALLVYGVVMELAQGLTPSRSASLADLLADAFGIAIGWWITHRSSRQPAEHRG
jgi:VanZ family protein